MTIRVLIADDQMMVRQGFTVLLGAEPGIEVVGQAVDGVDAVEQVAELAPDVVLMDIRMPRLGGIDATRRIARDSETPVKVLVLTTFDLDVYVFDALRAGASGFLLKDVHPSELLQGIRVVASGESVLSPSATRRLIGHYASGEPTRIHAASGHHELDSLTARERFVLTLVASGLTNMEIGAELGITVGTVKSHVNALLRKLGLRDRVQATILAYDVGLAHPNPPGAHL